MNYHSIAKKLNSYELSRIISQTDYTDLQEFHSGNSLEVFIRNMFGKTSYLKSRFKKIKPCKKRDIHGRGENSVCLEMDRNVDIFKTIKYHPNRCWVGCISNHFLDAYLSVYKEEKANKFYLFSHVKFHNLIGKLYFYSIFPFHHLIVHFMGKKGGN